MKQVRQEMNNHKSRLTVLLVAISDVLFLSLGLWTVYCNIFVYTGRTFNELLHWSFVPIAVFLLLILWGSTRWAKQAPFTSVERCACRPFIHWPLALFCSGIIVGIYFVTNNFILWWIGSVAWVCVALFSTRFYAQEKPSSIREKISGNNLILISLIAVTVVYCVFARDRDWESPFYLSMGIYSAEFFDKPLLQNDWLHGEHDLIPLGFYYLVHSYELLIAFLSQFTDIKQIVWFFEIFPLFFSAMLVIVHWLALLQLGNDQRNALAGIILIVLVWMTWGNEARTIGNFGFPRLMTGKAVLVSVVIPAVYYYVSRYREHGDLYSWVVLVCSQIAGVGMSSSGMVAVPLATGIVLISRLEKEKKAIVRTVTGLLPLLYIVFLALASMRLETRISHELPSHFLISTIEKTSEQGLMMVLGEKGLRSYLALFCLLAIPVIPMVNSLCQRRMAKLVLVMLLVVVNPFTASLLNTLVGNMYWRTFWSIPFPLLIGLTGAYLSSNILRIRNNRFNYIAFGALAIAFILPTQPWTISWDKIQWHSEGKRPYYEDSYYEVADTVAGYFDSEDLLLAPTRVTMWLIAFEGHPRLVSVRPPYSVKIFSYMEGKKEAFSRLILQRAMDGDEIVKDKENDIDQIVILLEQKIKQLRISGIVLDRTNNLYPPSKILLERIGFQQMETVDDFVIWKKQN